MFTKSCGNYRKGAKKQSTLGNSLFIQQISEEDRYDKSIEDVFMRSTKENPYLKKLNSTILICEALKGETKKNLVDSKRELYRRRNRPELKALELQLRAAYVSKTIAAQKAEREALAIEATAKEAHENLELERARLRLDEFIKLKNRNERMRKLALQQDLKEQMALVDAKRQREKLKIIKEKQMVDEDLKRLKEDEIREAREALEKKQKIRSSLEEFKKMQDEWKLKQHQATEKENEKLEQFLKQSENLKVDTKKIWLEDQERKKRISEKIGCRTSAAAEAKNKAFDRLVELLIDERKAKEEMKSIADQKNQVLQKIVIRGDLDQLVEQKKRQRLEEKRQNEVFSQQNLRALAEMDKIQRERDEKKRISTEEHRKALQSALDEKKRLRAEEMKRLLLENSKELQEKTRKANLVEIARLKLLKEHASNLKGFLPSKLFKQSDREHLSM